MASLVDIKVVNVPITNKIHVFLLTAYAVSHLKLPLTEFVKAWNEKLGSARQTVLRNKAASEAAEKGESSGSPTSVSEDVAKDAPPLSGHESSVSENVSVDSEIERLKSLCEDSPSSPAPSDSGSSGSLLIITIRAIPFFMYGGRNETKNNDEGGSPKNDARWENNRGGFTMLQSDPPSPCRWNGIALINERLPK